MTVNDLFPNAPAESRTMVSFFESDRGRIMKTYVSPAIAAEAIIRFKEEFPRQKVTAVTKWFVAGQFHKENFRWQRTPRTEHKVSVDYKPYWVVV
jgi:hypothetical protein